jgi:hypothetical protein
MTNIDTGLDFEMPDITEMRSISTHTVPVAVLPQVLVTAVLSGGHYTVHPPGGGWAQHIMFQDGHPLDMGLNGVSVESLLAIIIDKIESDLVHSDPTDPYMGEAWGILPPLRKAMTRLRDAEIRINQPDYTD